MWVKFCFAYTPTPPQSVISCLAKAAIVSLVVFLAAILSLQEMEDLQEEHTMTRCVADPVEEQEYRAAWTASTPMPPGLRA